MKIGFLEILTLIFVAAKVFGVIDWRWRIVLLPYMIYVILIVIYTILKVIRSETK